MSGKSIDKMFSQKTDGDERGFLLLGVKQGEVVKIQTAEGEIEVGFYRSECGLRIGIKAPRSMRVWRPGSEHLSKRKVEVKLLNGNS